MPKHEAATTRNHPHPPPFDQTAAIIRPCHLRAATGLSPTTVWRLRRAGQFPPAIQVGRAAIGWRRADIEAWLAERVKAY